MARSPERAYFWYMVLDQARSFAIRMYADAARQALADEVPDVDRARLRRQAAAWLAQHGETKK